MRLLTTSTSIDVRSCCSGFFSLDLMALMLLLGSVCHAAADTPSHHHEIPTFSIQELTSFSRRQELKETLSSTGLLAVRWTEDDNNTDYERNRHTALQGLCECHDHPHFLETDQTRSLRLPDEATVRTSVATATIGLEHPLPLPEEHLKEICGAETLQAMESLRESLHDVSKAFVGALDDLIGQNTGGSKNSQEPLLRDNHGQKTYSTVSEIVESASHLEHFHVYTKDRKQTSGDRADSAAAAWDWHTDAGLFLVFVPAWNCQDHRVEDASFWYKDERGHPVLAHFDGAKTAIVMLGQGAQDWLNLKSKTSPVSTGHLSLKPTVHSVRWDEQRLPFQRRSSFTDQLQRAWYGMMYLVPETAMIYGAKTLRDVRSALSWSKRSKNEVSGEDMDPASAVSIGCGISDPPVAAWNEEEAVTVQVETMRRRLQHQDPSSCNNVTNFFCWMQCLEIPGANQAQSYVNEGYSLYCLDPAVLASSGNRLSEAAAPCEGGFVHNANCLGSWQPSAPGVPAANVNVTADTGNLEQPFCYSGTTMYMDGFHFIQSTTCVIFLFQSWVLNTGGKYALAFFGTLFAGICLEKLIQQRRKTMGSMEAGRRRLAVSATFYGVQLTLGYMLMLIIMVYAGALFIATVLGLVFGHILFNAKDAIWPLEPTKTKLMAENACKKSEAPTEDLEQSLTVHSGGPKECSSQSEPSPDSAVESTCCGKKVCEGASSKSALGDQQLIPEGSTPCCQYSSCE